MIIIPRTIDLDNFINQVEKVFLTRLQIDKNHLYAVLDGSYEICRMYGQVNGVKIGFRVMCNDVLEILCSKHGSVKPIRNIAAIGQSRIIKDTQWSFKHRKYVKIIYPHIYGTIANSDVLIVEARIFSKNKDKLSALGTKFLTSEILFDSCNTKLALNAIWSMFVEHSLKHSKNLSNEQMVNSIFRSERFSESFCKKLEHRIQVIRRLM
ncbi:MAG: hypothetical protein WCC74_03070 [Minisyncoccia bacterium]